MQSVPYSSLSSDISRLSSLLAAFESRFGKGGDIFAVSAPGRIEVLGNHTDHNGGRAVAAAVTQDILCVCRKREDKKVSLFSESTSGDLYHLSLSLENLSSSGKEKNSSQSLIRGVAAYLLEKRFSVCGFDAYFTSRVQTGSGLSSSAAFESCVAAVFDVLANGGKLSPLDTANAGRFAENVYFGKPSGLMDQTASSFGGLIEIDFADPDSPTVNSLPGEILQKSEFVPYIVNCRSSHGDMTDEYAGIPREMKEIAACFGKARLIELPENDFLSHLSFLREKCGDRAVLRALHFYTENARVRRLSSAIRTGDLSSFLSLVRESGLSSKNLLQNIYPSSDVKNQPLSVALALCDLVPGTASRVHGGGFAGTVLSFVPSREEDRFTSILDGVFGEGSAVKAEIRPSGACRVLL